jgi:hypothetical protein
MQSARSNVSTESWVLHSGAYLRTKVMSAMPGWISKPSGALYDFGHL